MPGADGNLREISPRLLLLLFTLINFLTFVDRGIIPGASTKFSAFISASLEVERSQQNRYLGMLQSSFIAGYAVAAIVCGHLVHSVSPFNLVGGGLIIWCVALFLCGAAESFDSFWLLLFARVISGIGEASFQCVVPPFIDDQAPGESKALWLGIFFTAIPVGTAVGYGYGASVAASLSWQWAFYFVAIAMCPLACFCFYLARLGYGLRAAGGDRESGYTNPNTREPQPSNGGQADGMSASSAPSMLSELQGLSQSSIYVCVVLGYAAFSASVAGFSNFGPQVRPPRS
jgi:MFS family permease